MRNIAVKKEFQNCDFSASLLEVRREIGKYVKLKYFQWKIALDIDRFRVIRVADGHDPNMLTFIERLQILQKYILYARSNFEIWNKKFKTCLYGFDKLLLNIHPFDICIFVCLGLDDINRIPLYRSASRDIKAISLCFEKS